LPGSRLAAAVIVSTHADEPFFRGVEPSDAAAIPSSLRAA
jgi:hypothetical protein